MSSGLTAVHEYPVGIAGMLEEHAEEVHSGQACGPFVGSFPQVVSILTLQCLFGSRFRTSTKPSAFSATKSVPGLPVNTNTSMSQATATSPTAEAIAQPSAVHNSFKPRIATSSQ